MAKKSPSKKKCSCCGKDIPLQRGFYSSKSPLYAADGKINICKECFVKSALNLETNEIDEAKLKNILRKTDYPFYKDILQSSVNEYARANKCDSADLIAHHGDKVVAIYLKNINTLKQVSEKTFEDSERDGFLCKTSKVFKNTDESMLMFDGKRGTEEKDNEDIKWNKKDKQNMKYAIATVGYDPFEDVGLSEFDRKYCFNILASYCDTEGIREDGHKLQGVIEMALLYCQCRRITEAMNLELTRSDVDETKVQKLTQSKSSLLKSIADIAKDNNISSQYNKNSKQGKNSLTSKMKEMEENGFAEIKVNLFDIKTSEAFKQIDAISNENIANQLTLDSSEYSDIVKEQREKIIKMEEQIDYLEEENRNLKNKIIDLENKKR